MALRDRGNLGAGSCRPRTIYTVEVAPDVWWNMLEMATTQQPTKVPSDLLQGFLNKYQPAGGILFIRTYFEDVLKSIDRWSFGERRNKGHYVDSVTNMITLKISCLKGNLIAKKNQKILF